MSVRTKIRKVVDARRDIDGTEDASNCNMVGWTTHYVNGFTNPTDAYNNYSYYFMSGLLQPHQDGVVVHHINQTAVASSTPPAEVGLKHYKHQMQAMKSISFPDTMADDFPSNASSSLGVIGTDGYLANPSNPFATVLSHPTGVSMGELRGFRYHRTGHSAWESSTSNGDGQERLGNTLEIGIGQPVGGGTGGA